PLGIEEVGDGFERSRFAGAVGAEQRDDAAPRYRQRHALQYENDVIVDDLDVVDLEDRLLSAVCGELGLSFCGGGPLHWALSFGRGGGDPPDPTGPAGLGGDHDGVAPGSVGGGRGRGLVPQTFAGGARAG